jgi:hypothetical protein
MRNDDDGFMDKSIFIAAQQKNGAVHNLVKA